MDEIKLKQCPFCGGEAEVKKNKTHIDGYYCFVRCVMCHSSGKAFYVKHSMKEEKQNEQENKAVNAWNQRSE